MKHIFESLGLNFLICSIFENSLDVFMFLSPNINCHCAATVEKNPISSFVMPSLH